MPTTIDNLLPIELRDYVDKLFPFGLASALDEIIYEELTFNWSDIPLPQTDLSEPDALDNVSAFVDPELEELVEKIWLTFYFKGRLTRPLNSALPSAPGVELILGGGRIELAAEVNIESKTFEVWLGSDTITMRFSRDLLVPITGSPGSFVDDPNPNQHVEIPLNLRIGLDESGATFFRWPENSPDFVELPDCRIANTNYTIINGKLRMDFAGEERGIAVQWEESQMAEFIGNLSPALAHREGAIPSSTISGRILLGESQPIQEVRLDWKLDGTPIKLGLPGLDVQLPGDLMISLLLGAGGRPLHYASLVLSLSEPPAGASAFTFTSSFAWERDGERELQTNRTPPRPGAADPFLTVELSNTGPASLVLFDIDLTLDELPRLFQEFLTPLTPLDFDNPETLFEPTLAEFVGPYDHWTGKVKINADAFRMPFLEQSENNALANQFEQWVVIKPKSGQTEAKIDFGQSEVELPFDVTLKFGDVAFTGDLNFRLNWQTMSLAVNHESGISLASNKADYSDSLVQHLGLYWRLRGASLDNGRYEYFRVVTKGYNYQVQMAQGAAFELEYREISDEPIVFIVSDFILSPKGIDLVAEVSDRPARLNGIDTRFRFSGSRLEVKENTIKDLTLAGSGPLPPDLVGESMVDIALQFKQVDGSLTLVAGSAQLQGNKLLDCQGTHFQFAVDAIGLKFVLENRFHLYFTLTGSAQFVLGAGESDGALALLPKIKIDMVECPLCADVSVLAKHIKFLVELPKPLKFSFLGCFEFELRGFGFVPQAEVLGGIGAMMLSGQIFFAQGGGDMIEAKIDFHNLYIGLPKQGEFVPQLYFKRIAVKLKVGEAFELNGAVDFYDDATLKGFAGEGMVDLKGMPQLAAAFSFVRVRRDENSAWVRAWFIYLEVRKVSFMIPVVQIYLREVGLGFGYRYTIASIKAVDRENDVRKLRAELVKLSRTQAELAKIQSWEVDLEDPGQDPRWTIVFRAMIAQNSASPGALQYSEQAEQDLSNLFLLDAMIAFRSDLTFYMVVRGWLNTNYHEFVANADNQRERPLVSGFVLLSPRRKMFLMAAASNPDGYIGDHPPLPGFVKDAIRSVTFSTTLLIMPGLIHFELGWPNKLAWSLDLGILKIECRGGFIFRVTSKEMVLGISYEARGRLEIKAELDLGMVGVWVSAVVEVGFGARVIAVLPFNDPLGTIVYGSIGLELKIRLEFGFWIKIKLAFVRITLQFSFSLEVGFTAGVEIAIGIPPELIWGVRGQGTLWIAVMGHRLQVNARLGIRDEIVQDAFDKTKHVLDLGMEGGDVGELPGFGSPQAAEPSAAPAGTPRMASPSAIAGAGPLAAVMVTSAPTKRAAQVGEFHPPQYTVFVVRAPAKDAKDRWSCFVLLPRGEYLEDERIFQDGDTRTVTKVKTERGFLPPPPLKLTFAVNDSQLEQLNRGEAPVVIVNELPDFTVSQVKPAAAGAWLMTGTDGDGKTRQYNLRQVDTNQIELTQIVNTDFKLTFPLTDNRSILQYDPVAKSWQPRGGAAQSASWAVRWDAPAFTSSKYAIGADGKPVNKPEAYQMNLADYIAQAFLSFLSETSGQSILTGDPDTDLFTTTYGDITEDSRVYNPSDNAFESAVRGAAEQFAGSPFFRLDTSNPYDQLLKEAFNSDTTIYHAGGRLPADESATAAQIREAAGQNQAAIQARGMIIHAIIADLRTYADYLASQAPAEHDNGLPPSPAEALDVERSIPFNMGLVFAYKGDSPAWLDALKPDGITPTILQRRSPTALDPDGEKGALVKTFNRIGADFVTNPPEFSRVQHYTSSNTIAITWDLTWHGAGQEPDPVRDDPDHCLAHYEVRRRTLDGREREVVYTVKAAEALHRETEGQLRRLRSRFNVVDNFNHETPEEQAAIPFDGWSYLYTITPVDFTGARSGRPLTLVATRYPSQPPPVSANAQLVISYDPNDFSMAIVPAFQPVIVMPKQIELLNWAQGVDTRRGPRVAVAKVYLLFRKEQTLPIGSYGLDAATAVERFATRPLSNARALPTDIRVEVTGKQNNPVELRDALMKANVLPGPTAKDGPSYWRPEAWTVFIQTESLNGVRSGLVPVELLMKVVGPTAQQDDEEKRQLAMLEWLAQPLRFPFLPPEDQAARTGTAHFPMPGGTSTFAGSLEGITHKPHPAGVRAVRFRWNQAPSASRDYPLNLNAGYHLYQLDVDAHADATMAKDPRRLLRRIQEVQMVPAEDLPLIPGDTLAVNQWEAWYPSAVRRQELANPVDTSSGGLQTRSSWYSWRESKLIWPPCPAELVGEISENGGAKRFARLKQLHPSLESLINDLRSDFHVDLQLYPPDMPGDLAAFMQTTSSKNDVYGWGVLQRFGLSVTFSLRDRATAILVPAARMLAAVKQRLDNKGIIADELKPHLFVELLFQASHAVSLVKDSKPEDDDLLAIVQVSLRPVVQQLQNYRKVILHGKPGVSVQLGLRIHKDAPVSLRNLSQERSGQLELVPDRNPSQDKVWKGQFKMPSDGRLVLVLRSVTPPDPLVQLSEDEMEIIAPKPPNKLSDLNLNYIRNENDTAWFLALTDAIADEQIAKLRETLGDSEPMKALAERVLAIEIESLVPTAPEVTAFSVSDEMIAEIVAAPDESLDWVNYRKYVESLSGKDEPRISVPTNGDALKALLSQYLDWTARFFEHGGNVVGGAAGLGRTDSGPWLATAYPSATTPSYVAPDESGRLKYDHLIEDKWAHNYRHYILPYGRYDLLWQSLWQSPTLTQSRAGSVPLDDLTPEELRMPTIFPDGGLDVVLDRTQPVERPLILRSGRLDRPAQPGQPVPPGATWEVIIAKHTEQTMVERNQTLARQVAFRQLSFTLLRRFGYLRWREALEKMVNLGRPEPHFHIEARPVATYEAVDSAALPDGYPPPTPDHIDLDKTLTEAEGLSLDLPQRLAPFQQGALVLQWQGLPFYYEHKLLVVAQSVSTLSPVNEVIQRDFEYVAPTPSPSVSLHPLGKRTLAVKIPLNSLWESLPGEAQVLWQSEKPEPEDSAHETSRKYASLPDPEVVYQIVETFNGNVEVQVEYLYEEKREGDILHQHYFARQLGQHFSAVDDSIRLLPPLTPQGRFYLIGNFENRLEGEPAAVEEVLWEKPAVIPNDLAPLVEWPDAQRWVLVWKGKLDEVQRDQLEVLRGDRAFKEAVQQLLATAHPSPQSELLRVPLPLPPEPLPDGLAEHYQLEHDDGTHKYTGLTWLGGTVPDQQSIEKLQTWGSRTTELAEAVASLVAKFADVAASPGPVAPHEPVTMALDIEMRPEQSELPEALAGQLLLGRRPILCHQQIGTVAAAQLQELFASAPEKDAIRRLALAMLDSTLTGRRLEIRTRRGSATPSARIPIALRAEGV